MGDDETSVFAVLRGPARAERERLRRVVARTLEETDATRLEPLFRSRGRRFELRFESCWLPERALEALLLQLERAGAMDVRAERWADGTGETLHGAIVAGALHQFDSLDALRAAQANAAGPAPRDVDFDYGRPRDRDTAIIRLALKSAAQGAPEAEVFADFLASDGGVSARRRFSSALERLFDSGATGLEFRWCGFREHGSHWCEGPGAMIGGLRFVTTQSNDLYLGFNLDGIDTPAASGDSDPEATVAVLVATLLALRGVKRVWFKLRRGCAAGRELYTTWPFPTDEPVVVERPLSAETDWPPI